MSDIAIRVENLGKRYRIGKRLAPVEGRRSLARAAAAPFRYLASTLREPNPDEVVWSLRDVSFTVRRGEVMGVIGRNGAGKSTLLKILSRITEPTTGRVEIHGRVGSLLEVGTGFHPELTGRENVYLNGAILGMRKVEIDRKFDEIVAFAEVDRFLDTPVKRYSSGMYVRLAFAVAAHLEPEILLVDEVLAVGDGAFQQKCLGKMGDVAREGRTVLFVSHNMGSVATLCQTGLLLEGGGLALAGAAPEVTSAYRRQIRRADGLASSMPYGSLASAIRFDSIRVDSHDDVPVEVRPCEAITIRVTGSALRPVGRFQVALPVHRDGVLIATLLDVTEPELIPAGPFEAWTTVPANLLRPGDYTVGIIGKGHQEAVFYDDALPLHVAEEWSDDYQACARGILNVPCRGGRRVAAQLAGGTAEREVRPPVDSTLAL